MSALAIEGARGDLAPTNSAGDPAATNALTVDGGLRVTAAPGRLADGWCRPQRRSVVRAIDAVFTCDAVGHEAGPGSGCAIGRGGLAEAATRARHSSACRGQRSFSGAGEWVQSEHNGASHVFPPPSFQSQSRFATRRLPHLHRRDLGPDEQTIADSPSGRVTTVQSISAPQSRARPRPAVAGRRASARTADPPGDRAPAAARGHAAQAG